MPARSEALARWAREHWPGGDPGPLRVEPIPADGSPRLFARLIAPGGERLVAMAGGGNPAEDRAWLYFARRLGDIGLPVARVHAAELPPEGSPEPGRFLMADLGGESLMARVKAAGGDQERAALYEPVLAALALLQAKGGEGLDQTVCFDGPALDPEFLREREAGYFLREMVRGAAGLEPGDWPVGLEAELDEVSRRAGAARPWGLAHRDMQSRNVVWGADGPGLVDFQGARLGPAAYDLAALVHDPYVDLAWGLRETLVERYIILRAGLGPFDAAAFREGLPWVAASRLMQALGAYAFLTRRRGRGHFAQYARPALAGLNRLLSQPPLEGLGALRALAAMLPLDPLEAFPEEGRALEKKS